jgi:acetyl esterase/lipase
MKKYISSLLLISIFISVAYTQPAIKTIKLWTDSIPGAISNPAYKEQTIVSGTKIIYYSHVTDPTLMVYLPAPEKRNGTAVVICPGGGYGRLAFDHEGYQVAEWFNSIGVTAIILKYRLPNDTIMKDKTIGPLQDAQEALRVVRRHATDWKINPAKVGIMGFSAGGHLAATASTHYDRKVYIPTDTISARPDFSILIYPVISMDPYITHAGSSENLLGKKPTSRLINEFSNETQVNNHTPVTFLVHSSDDGAVPVKNTLRYFENLNRNGVPVEMHIYRTGGHGYGLGKNKTSSEGTWPEALKHWMKDNNLI